MIGTGCLRMTITLKRRLLNKDSSEVALIVAMTKKEISTFEALQGQLQSFYQELTTLTKKSPNDGLNNFKLGLVNSVLKESNKFLGGSRRPFVGFEEFDDAVLPSNSDVLIIVSQYISAFEKLRADNAQYRLGGGWYWICSDDPKDKPSIRMAVPRKIS